jgi:hypothetical protein
MRSTRWSSPKCLHPIIHRCAPCTLRSISFFPIFDSHRVCFRFVTVGSNGNLETSPPIVHFGGFRTENIHELTVSNHGSLLHRSCTVCCNSCHHLPLLFQVRVINKSDKKQRIHVLPPQTPSFKFDVTNNGFIRPGLAQDIKITFRPSEYRYYYDCVRLHCPGQNILVRESRLNALPAVPYCNTVLPGTNTRIPCRRQDQLPSHTRLWNGTYRPRA